MKFETNLDKEGIKKLLIQQLYKDYDHLLYSYRVTLKRPLIEIRPSLSFYGLWCAQTRSLSLSESLVFQYPWEYVLEVLKHEMAHQYVTDVYGEEEKAHGPSFKKACDIFRVKPWARKSCLSLEDDLLEVSKEKGPGQEDKSFRLVKKLLSLSHSSNQNEALLALRKASEIAKRYNIDLTSLKNKEDFCTLTKKMGRTRVHGYETLIGSLLSSHFHVQVIHSSLYHQERMREEKTLEILGDTRSVQMADYVFTFLIRKLESLWEEKTSGARLGIKAKHQFFLGVLDGFRSALDRSEREQKVSSLEPREEALLLREREEKLRSYLQYQFPRIHHVKSGSYSASSYEYSKGYDEGKKLKIREPLVKSNLKKIGSSR